MRRQKSLVDRRMSFDNTVDINYQDDPDVFTDTFEVINVEEYDSHYDQDAVTILFRPNTKSFNISEIVNITEGGKLSLLLQKMFPNKDNLKMPLSSLVGRTVKLTAVKKVTGYFTVFPEMTAQHDLVVSEWK